MHPLESTVLLKQSQEVEDALKKKKKKGHKFQCLQGGHYREADSIKVRGSLSEETKTL